MFPASVWSEYYPNLSIQDSVLRLKAAGFTHTELSITHTEQLVAEGTPERTGAQLQQFFRDEGFTVPQGHLSFSKGLCSEEAIDLLKRELALYQALGITNAVLHFNGGKGLPPEEQFSLRVEGIRKLQPMLKGTPLHLCLENLGSVPDTHTAQKLLHIMDTVGGENLAICLDTGHLHLVNGRGEAEQTQREFILTAGSHLRAMHVTENNGKNDVHQMPYSARYGIDWPQVVAALREVGYRGLFNLEILGERNAPEAIKEAKLRFIREMVTLMLA